MPTPEPHKPNASPETSEPAESQTVPKPVLASEVLMEELAPLQPWARSARAWATACGLLFAALGLAPALLGVAGGDALGSFAIGGATLATALLPMRYGARAAFMVAIGAICAGLGIVAVGPAAVLERSVGTWAFLHWIAATGLPAALLFRARYRAYLGARYILVAAFGASLPFVGYCLLMLSQGDLAIQVANGVALAAVALGAVGFMGSNTPVAGSWVAGTIIAAVTAALGGEVLLGMWGSSGTAETAWAAGSVVALGAANLLGALGVFQLLAVRYCREARIVALDGEKAETADVPSFTDSWSTRK